MTSVAVRDARVRFGSTTVLDGVDLEVGEGEWLGLIGPNGAGKTTLLRVVAGLAAATGDVTFGGRPASELRHAARARLVAMVPQRPLIPSGMTVFDYVLMGRTPYIGYFDTESHQDLATVAAVLERLGVARFAERPLGSMSGGEQQRVILARALAQQAPVLLLDEGTNALDVGAQQEVLELVASLRVTDGLTVISAMHDLTLAGQFPDRLVLLSGGRVVAHGPPKAVLTEAAVAKHFRATVRIVDEPDGTVAVVPVRSER